MSACLLTTSTSMRYVFILPLCLTLPRFVPFLHHYSATTFDHLITSNYPASLHQSSVDCYSLVSIGSAGACLFREEVLLFVLHQVCFNVIIVNIHGY
jgi:hypothetical protein